MAAVEYIGVGQTVRLDAEVWLVERIDGAVVYLQCDGRYRALPLDELVARREPLDETATSTADADEMWLATQHPEVIRAALERLAHLQEVWTGYRSGTPERPAPGEPRDLFNPLRHDTDARMRHKAAELGVAVATVYRWQRRYLDMRLRGLVNQRRLAPKDTAAQQLDDRLKGGIEDEMKATVDASNVSKKAFKQAVSWRLRRELGDDIFERPDGIRLPPRSTYDRALSQVCNPLGFFKGTAENRRSIDSRPKRAYRGRKLDAPGQVVAIDSTPLDTLFWDPVSQQYTKYELHGALDMFDFQIVARRLVPQGSLTAVDAALLLRDMMTPKVADPDWPAEARWRYHGLPATLVLDPGTGQALAEPLSSIAPVVPNAVLVDRAGAYRSASFEEACALYDINIDYARPRRGSDKANIERLWNTVGTSFSQYLAGYTGGRPHRRGRDVESDAVLLKGEGEDLFDHWNAVIWQNEPRDGLRLEENPERMLTPAEMFDEALSRGGYLRIPADPDAFHKLLPGKWRHIHHDGVRMFGLRYDAGDELNRFRGQVSPYDGPARGRWLIRYDPRDLRQVWFCDVDRRLWIELRWKGRRERARPLDEYTVRYAKRLTLRTGDPDRDSEALQRNIEALQDRMRDVSAAARERRMLGRATDRAQTAESDAALVGLAHPPETSLLDDDDAPEFAEDDMQVDDERLAGVPDDDASIDQSPLTPYPSLGDLV